MIKLTIGDKEYNVPESWKDVNMEMYTKAFYNLQKTTPSMTNDEKVLITQRNEAKIISRLLGEKDDFALDLPLPLAIRLQEIIGFIYDIRPFMNNNVSYLKIDGVKYFMPAPNEMSLRQYIDTDMIMKEDKNPMQYVELLAALLVPYNDKGELEYDGKYQDRMEKIKKMNAQDALPFVYTFFKKKVLSKRISQASSKEMEEVIAQLRQHIQNS